MHALGAALFLGIVSPASGALLGLPAAVADTLRQASPEVVALGRRVFFDRRLSADSSVSCATCHDPARAFTDGRKVSVGVEGKAGTRNAPSLLDAAFSAPFFWDGRRASLEEQVLDPFVNPREQGLAGHDDLLRRIKADPPAVAAFEAAFPGEPDPATLPHLGRALAEYVRSLAVGDSPFDRFEYGGETGALGVAQQRGLGLFRGRARCSECHTAGAAGATFTDGRFHRIDIEAPAVASHLGEIATRLAALSPDQLDPLITADPAVAALGRFVVTLRPEDVSTFKTPSLRNVALTAPYFHDGSAATLGEAVEREIYYRGAERPLVLNPAERADLVAFLEALTAPAASLGASGERTTGGGR
ncbi:MAG: cytochrome-c peroxidase [Myxococcales bacterium]